MSDIPPFTAASFRQFLNEKKLMGSRCVQCGGLYLPPRAICPGCHSSQMEWVELGRRGKLAGFTCVYVAPTAMIQQGYGRDNPYVSGVVELAEGVKISARIDGVDPRDPASIQIGESLDVDFLEQGVAGKVTLAFRPEA